jgi:guanosine-3',5'-bis(diphosphate) 3'-pyrophosphohydrolase
VPGRIKDFIAMPRPNLYQSLHTTVMGEGGISSRCRSAPKRCIASPKKASPRTGSTRPATRVIRAKDEQRLAWVRQLVEWQREMTDPNEFLSTLKMDLYPEEVYTFTPKGKVVVLPKDARPIDFAYTIHTEVGHTCVGAKVNGRMVPLRTKLRNGDIVEITRRMATRPAATGSPSSRARARATRSSTGSMSTSGARHRDRPQAAGARGAQVQSTDGAAGRCRSGRVAGEYGLATATDLLAAIGFGKHSARQMLEQAGAGADTLLAERPCRRARLRSGHVGCGEALHFTGSDSLQVEGQNDLLVYRARCCNPIRGEEIIGYVTRGKGVAVHARSCPNVQNLLYESDRRIDVEWAKTDAEIAGRLQRNIRSRSPSTATTAPAC